MRKTIRYWVVVPVAGLLLNARAGELETARVALEDRLYAVAQTHAEKALKAGGDDAAQALLILLEALSGQGHYKEMLSRLDREDAVVLQSAAAGSIAYWRSQALLNTGAKGDA